VSRFVRRRWRWAFLALGCGLVAGWALRPHALWRGSPLPFKREIAPLELLAMELHVAAHCNGSSLASDWRRVQETLIPALVADGDVERLAADRFRAVQGLSVENDIRYGQPHERLAVREFGYTETPSYA
jgi:hypothetical protein